MRKDGRNQSCYRFAGEFKDEPCMHSLTLHVPVHFVQATIRCRMNPLKQSPPMAH